MRLRSAAICLAAAALAGSGVAAAESLSPSASAGGVPAADMPNRSLTPGATFGSTRVEVCWPGYSASVRKLPSSKRSAVYARYHIRPDPYAYEVDRLISLELGGSNAIKNLWPEPYAGAWGARTKDRLESRLHRLVCSGDLTLAAAQRAIKANWVAAYQLYVLKKGPKLISTRPDVTEVDPTTSSAATTPTPVTTSTMPTGTTTVATTTPDSTTTTPVSTTTPQTTPATTVTTSPNDPYDSNGLYASSTGARNSLAPDDRAQDLRAPSRRG